MMVEEFRSASALVSPHAVMPWPPRIVPIARGFSALIACDVQPELEARTAPGHPDDRVAEDRAGERGAVGGGGDRDARIGVQVVDVGGIHERVHRRVDRGGGAALAVEAVVERGDHLVLAVDAGVHVDERAHAVEAEHGQSRLGERAQVAAGAFDPEQFDGGSGDGSMSVPLADVLPPA